MQSPTDLDPGRIIADCEEDDFVPLIIVSSPVNIQSRVIEAVVHNAATRGSQLGIVISLAAVDPHKYHTPALELQANLREDFIIMEKAPMSEIGSLGVY